MFRHQYCSMFGGSHVPKGEAAIFNPGEKTPKAEDLVWLIIGPFLEARVDELVRLCHYISQQQQNAGKC